MFSGAQISLYPMADDFVGVILGALGALDPYRDRLRIETDDISTLLVGPPEVLFPALRDLFVAAAQFSLYVMGTGDHIDEIYGCIDFLKQSGVYDRSKNFCTKLRGDTGAIFSALNEAFCRFGPGAGHVTLDVTVSANSPTAV